MQSVRCIAGMIVSSRPGVCAARLPAALVIALLFLSAFRLEATPASPNKGGTAAVAVAPGDVQAGMDLFTGRRRLQNGGPACASCHNVATLPFPHGGTMAPDLTHEYSKLGPQGMHYALRTLYFPAMNALYLKRQLTDAEERDLTAFFQDADRAQPAGTQTGVIGGAAVLGFLVLMGITWASGRGRVYSVRRKLLKRAGVDREAR